MKLYMKLKELFRKYHETQEDICILLSGGKEVEITFFEFSKFEITEEDLYFTSENPNNEEDYDFVFLRMSDIIGIRKN